MALRSHSGRIMRGPRVRGVTLLDQPIVVGHDLIPADTRDAKRSHRNQQQTRIRRDVGHHAADQLVGLNGHRRKLESNQRGKREQREGSDHDQRGLLD